MTETSGDEPMAETGLFLDYQATTPCDPRVLETMLPYYGAAFGNPHSAGHDRGRRAAAAVERAREEIAALIGAEAREIAFTSGATESNNLAIKGAARFLETRGKRHLISVVSEHKSVLEPLSRLEGEGFAVTLLPVDRAGLVDPQAVAAAIREDTALVSVMAVNNEIGVLQPIAEIAALCRARGVVFHSDAAQAFGKIRLDVEAMQVDLMSISGHKIYAPMGIGALYVRRRPRVRLIPLFDGGGQERGLRSGTLPLPLCVGLGRAAALAAEEMPAEAARLAGLRDRLLGRLEEALEGVHLNGAPKQRIPGNLNLRFDGIDALELLAALPELALATGSACTSTSVAPSHVLRALGLENAEARGALRLGLGRFTSAEQVDLAADRLIAAVRALRGQASDAAE